jgi:small basic protein
VLGVALGLLFRIQNPDVYSNYSSLDNSSPLIPFNIRVTGS